MFVKMYFLKSLCCVCLSDIKDFPNGNEQLKKKLRFCFPDIEFVDTLRDICNECSRKLQMCLEFKHLYLNSQARLKRYLLCLSQDNQIKCGILSLELQDVIRCNDRVVSQMCFEEEILTRALDMCLKTKKDDFIEYTTTSDVEGYNQIYQNRSVKLESVSHLKKKDIKLDDKLHDEIFKDMLKTTSVKNDIDFTAVKTEPENDHETCVINEYEEYIEIVHHDLHIDAQSGESARIKEEYDDFYSYGNTGTELVSDIKDGEMKRTVFNIFEEQFWNEKFERCSSSNVSNKVAAKEKHPVFSCVEKQKKVQAKKKQFSCDTCSYKCNEANKLRSHISTHKNKRRFSCDKCSYTCYETGALKIHKQIHVPYKPLSCDVCSYRCNTSNKLMLHKRTHTEEKPYSCDLCDYRAIWSYRVKQHRKTHTGEKPFACDMCSYECVSSSRLKDHKRIHTGERPYYCNVCDYSCAWSSLLTIHKRTHTGEKPFSCNVCNYKSNSSSRLTEHQKMHARKKFFPCNTCNYRCATFSSLQQHKTIHTSAEISC